MPKRDYEFRQKFQNYKNFTITTNLFQIKFIDEFHKFALFSLVILPEIAKDNSSLLRKVFSDIVLPQLPKSFKKNILSGQNLYSFIAENENKDINDRILEIVGEVYNTKYRIKLEKVKDISFYEIKDFNGENQQIKSI